MGGERIVERLSATQNQLQQVQRDRAGIGSGVGILHPQGPGRGSVTPAISRSRRMRFSMVG